jgi:hypothetical protein
MGMNDSSPYKGPYVRSAAPAHDCPGPFCEDCIAHFIGWRDDPRPEAPASADLARALLSLADTAGMPDGFWATDSRVTLARQALGVPDDGRYSHSHLWSDG